MFPQVENKSYPLRGQWELTCRCNLKCLMCYTDCFNTPEKIRQELTCEEIRRILDELEDAGCLELCFTGGEPFCRPDFLELYAYARQKGFLITIFTNGTLITPRIADFLKANPPAMIELSLHGFTKASFEKITQGKKSHDRFAEAVQFLLERNLPLTFKTTGMTINRGEIFKIKEYVRGLGSHVQYRFGSDIIPRLDGSTDVFAYQLPQAAIEAIEQSDPEFRADRAKQDQEGSRAAASGKDVCRGGFHKFHIDAYGMLQLCSNNRQKGYDLRRGSFRHGFYEVLPAFPCPKRDAGGGFS